MCILLVEDEKLIRELLAEELSCHGFDVCESLSGDHAATLIHTPPQVFTLLITDINMPGRRNGMQVGRLMRLRWPTMPIVFMTGRPDIANWPGPLGTNEILLRKPFGMLKLLDVVTTMLDRSGGLLGNQSQR